jgi:hypothetical protein
LNLRPLDPQQRAGAVGARQARYAGSMICVLRPVSCRSFAAAEDAWSPDGPQRQRISVKKSEPPAPSGHGTARLWSLHRGAHGSRIPRRLGSRISTGRVAERLPHHRTCDSTAVRRWSTCRCPRAGRCQRTLLSPDRQVPTTPSTAPRSASHQASASPERATAHRPARTAPARARTNCQARPGEPNWHRWREHGPMQRTRHWTRGDRRTRTCMDHKPACTTVAAQPYCPGKFPAVCWTCRRPRQETGRGHRRIGPVAIRGDRALWRGRDTASKTRALYGMMLACA